MSSTFIHSTAVVESRAILCTYVKVWHFCHIRKGAILNRGVNLGKDVYVDETVEIGEYSRVQNGVSLYKGLEIAPWCFIGPHVIFTNDQAPRAGNINWSIVPTKLGVGTSIGAGAIIRCGVELGDFCMIGAGSIVTKNIPSFHIAIGSPAKIEKMTCACGQTQSELGSRLSQMIMKCCEANLDARALVFAIKSSRL
jgi:acetyltransferase-like isoleucine patch superfamily enzyme